MDFSLADEEIRLLKELKGVGELGRIFPQAQSVLARLIRAGYVKRRVIKLSADRYVITALGARRFLPPWPVDKSARTIGRARMDTRGNNVPLKVVSVHPRSANQRPVICSRAEQCN
jgi:hypothetical protein